MRVTKRQLRRIIREEKRRLLETGCAVEGLGDQAAAGPMVDLAAAPVVSESTAPEEAVLSEMATAVQALEQVVESVAAAAAICHDCVPAVAVQAPLMEAAVAQAQALQETLEAQAEVVAENADAGAAPLMTAVHDLVS